LFAALTFYFEFLFVELPTPKKLFGYWAEKILDIDNEEIEDQGLTMYEFECIDPIYKGYIIS